MPQLDESQDPWGTPISQWVEDIVPGLSLGEISGFQVIQDSAYGTFKNLGIVFEWVPARELDLASGQNLPQIFVSRDVDHRKLYKTDSIREECIAKIKEWLDDNYPNQDTRPTLGEPPAFNLNEYIRLTKSPITKHSDWGNPRMRRRARNQERIFVNSLTNRATDITLS